MRMLVSLARLKPALLAVAIVAGLVAHTRQAQAASTETAILAGGCFWCIESDFERVPGVKDVVSGYTGGTTKNPTYKQVTRGGTGHYEAVRITYDPAQISYAQILHMFMRSVDPTDPTGQFCDKGESYRTAIFVSDADEKAAAEAAIKEARSELGRNIVTPILPASQFYDAEDYHQDYYRKSEIVLTRRGPKTKAEAYKFYREACGRDQRVRQLWGSAAPFATH